jgi:hypothetical protein
MGPGVEDTNLEGPKTHSIRDFSIPHIPFLQKILEKKSSRTNDFWFRKLESNTSIFLSQIINIILDASLLNACLFDHGFGDDHFAIGIIEKAFLLGFKIE